MTRTKRGFIAQKRRKKILNFAKGFKGSHSKLYRTSNQQVMKSYRYSYFDRRKKKNNFKKIWIQRINANTRLLKKNYSKTINLLKINKILLNKKILSNLCISDPETFKKLLKIN
jgi:large subunit ribosomal protein L20